jgi:hypothetical protein
MMPVIISEEDQKKHILKIFIDYQIDKIFGRILPGPSD